MRQFKELSNGDLWIAEPHPPPAPSGYYQNPGNPNYYHLTLKECAYRIITKEKLCCNKSKEIMYCDYYEEVILQIRCRDCEL